VEGIDIGKSFTFVFEDEEWISKVLFGGLFSLLSFILIGIPFMLGYGLEVIRRAKTDDPQPLPDWSDLGGYFSSGIQAVVVAIVYALPIILLSCVGFVLGAAAGSSSNAVGFLVFLLNCLIFLWSLVMAVFLPAAWIKLAETGEVMSAFRFGEIWSFIRENLGNYFIAIVLGWVASVVAGFGIILCGIGIFFTYFWGWMVQMHLLGQVARVSQPPAATTFAPESV